MLFKITKTIIPDFAPSYVEWEKIYIHNSFKNMEDAMEEAGYTDHDADYNGEYIMKYAVKYSLRSLDYKDLRHSICPVL